MHLLKILLLLRLTPTQSRKEGEEEFQGEKEDTWSGSHEGGNTKKKREGDEKEIMSSCHENKKEAAITEMEAASSTYSNNVLLCKELLPPCKKNLLVLDINGILVDITSDYKYQQYADFKISGKIGFKRPFCVDFIKFCFANFEVGVWSSRKQHNLVEAVHHLFGEMKNKLLFCWDQSKCIDTKFKTVENKPLFFKELNKLLKLICHGKRGDLHHLICFLLTILLARPCITLLTQRFFHIHTHSTTKRTIPWG
ncbi:uncharacterized protein LOC144545802 [Carex rostrata]